MQRGPGGNFNWVGHNAFYPTNNWPVCLFSGKLVGLKMSDFKANLRAWRRRGKERKRRGGEIKGMG